MATSVFASGFFGTVTINGSECPVIQWSLSRTRTLVEFRNSLTGIYPFRDPTFGDIVASVVIDRDFANNPNGSPFYILPGQTLTNLVLYEKQTAKSAVNGPAHTISAAIINSTPVTTAVAGKVGYSFTAPINGTYTPPST